MGMRAICISGKLLISPHDDHGCPVLSAHQLFDLDANMGVGSHPHDFLAECGEAVKPVCIIRNRHWGDVGLAFMGTGHSSQFRTRQEFYAGLSSHALDQHGGSLVSSVAIRRYAGNRTSFFLRAFDLDHPAPKPSHLPCRRRGKGYWAMRALAG